MLLTIRTFACLHDERRFILIQRDPTRGGVGGGAWDPRVIMDVVTFVIILEAFVTDEAPPMISTPDEVTSFGFQGPDAAVRTFFERPVFGILLETLADGAEELSGL